MPRMPDKPGSEDAGVFDEKGVGTATQQAMPGNLGAESLAVLSEIFLTKDRGILSPQVSPEEKESEKLKGYLGLLVDGLRVMEGGGNSQDLGVIFKVAQMVNDPDVTKMLMLEGLDRFIKSRLRLVTLTKTFLKTIEKQGKDLGVLPEGLTQQDLEPVTSLDVVLKSFQERITKVR